MNVRERIRDAQALLNADRRDGAFFMVLLAILATARKRYPQLLPDQERFEQFLRDERRSIMLNGDYAWVQYWHDGQDRTFEQILWGIARSGMAHEGGFGTGFGVSDKLGWLVEIPTPGTMILSLGVLRRLVRTVLHAPENRDVLAGRAFWYYCSVASPLGGTVLVGEDWNSGQFDTPVGIKVSRIPEKLVVQPSPQAERGSLRLGMRDGREIRLP